ncbi:MAG: SH3 domain-containing protein, partial [Lachnospiraceae bacterium]|nr:SH3 domain-containing protein [Lachnospiraceae bacterium]
MDAKRIKQSIILAVSVIIVIILVLVIGKLIDKYTPSKEQQDLWEYYGLTDESQTAIVLNHEVIPQQAVFREGMIYLSYETVRDVFNSRFYWDYNENLLLYTTPEDVVSAAADSKEYFVTKDKKSENYTIVYADANTAYIALDYVKKYTDLEYEFFEEPNRVVVRTNWEDETGVLVKKDTQIRYRGGIKSPILTEVSKETELTVLEQGEDWDKVATKEGIIGYIKKKRLGKEETKTFEHSPMTETFSHILKDKKINMAWHQV